MKDIRSIRPRLYTRQERRTKDFDFCNFNFCVFFLHLFLEKLLDIENDRDQHVCYGTSHIGS